MAYWDIDGRHRALVPLAAFASCAGVRWRRYADVTWIWSPAPSARDLSTASGQPERSCCGGPRSVFPGRSCTVVTGNLNSIPAVADVKGCSEGRLGLCRDLPGSRSPRALRAGSRRSPVG